MTLCHNIETLFQTNSQLKEVSPTKNCLKSIKISACVPDWMTCNAHINLRVRIERVLFLTADGSKFTHPLHHLGKSLNDLPLIVIDSFQHMYIWRHDVRADMQ